MALGIKTCAVCRCQFQDALLCLCEGCRLSFEREVGRDDSACRVAKWAADRAWAMASTTRVREGGG